MLALVLVNLSIIFYWTQVLYPQRPGVDVLGPLVGLTGAFTDARLADVVFALNASALLLWEILVRRNVSWMRGRTFRRVVSLLALTPVVFSSLFLILGSLFGSEGRWSVLALLLFGGFTSISLFYFRFRVHDLFILTVCLLGGITIITTFIAQFSAGGFGIAFVLAFLVVGQTAGAALWLRHVAQQWEEAG